LTCRNTGSTSFNPGLYVGRKSRWIPAAAGDRLARFTAPLVCRFALSSTTTRGALDRGSDRTNARKSRIPGESRFGTVDLGSKGLVLDRLHGRPVLRTNSEIST
jgi:hypothetical protein